MTTTGTDRAASRAARTLLGCGVLAGPLYLAAALTQAATRDGFDLARHPISLLSVGQLGWVQIVNFVTAGLLFTFSAVGMRRVLHSGRGRTWGPLLIGVFGLSLIWGGIFVADPSNGFPPGTPSGTADTMSWHGALHTIAPVLAFVSLTVGCLVFTRRFADDSRRRWALASVGAAVATVAPDALIATNGFYLALAAATVTGMGWASAVAARLLIDTTRAAPAAPHPRPAALQPAPR